MSNLVYINLINQLLRRIYELFIELFPLTCPLKLASEIVETPNL